MSSTALWIFNGTPYRCDSRYWNASVRKCGGFCVFAGLTAIADAPDSNAARPAYFPVDGDHPSAGEGNTGNRGERSAPAGLRVQSGDRPA